MPIIAILCKTWQNCYYAELQKQQQRQPTIQKPPRNKVDSWGSEMSEDSLASANSILSEEAPSSSHSAVLPSPAAIYAQPLNQLLSSVPPPPDYSNNPITVNALSDVGLAGRIWTKDETPKSAKYCGIREYIHKLDGDAATSS